MNYNIRFALRWNNFIRKWFILPRIRRRLKNESFTLLANNCNGGFIYHDLGVRFNSPTINMFFTLDHYFDFLEHITEYLQEEIKPCLNPITQLGVSYPIMNLGGGGNGLKMIELHFMHYTSEEEAIRLWNKRRARIDLNNMYVIFTFFDDTDESWLRRFDALPQKKKIAFVNRPFSEYESAVYIPGYEESGLGRLNDYVNLKGERKYDSFDFVSWLNSK